LVISAKPANAYARLDGLENPVLQTHAPTNVPEMVSLISTPAVVFASAELAGKEPIAPRTPVLTNFAISMEIVILETAFAVLDTLAALASEPRVPSNALATASVSPTNVLVTPAGWFVDYCHFVCN
jgi:hypothetical protein